MTVPATVPVAILSTNVCSPSTSRMWTSPNNDDEMRLVLDGGSETWAGAFANVGRHGARHRARAFMAAAGVPCRSHDEVRHVFVSSAILANARSSLSGSGPAGW